MADPAIRHFLPWVRQGAAAGIATPDSLGLNQRADVALSVAVQFENFTVPTKDMKLYGPADVTAIDPRQIVRVQPRPLTTNFESNFFPLIEFDRPDFPWLFTPAKAGAGERLRPWICLIVVKKRAGVSLGRTETSPLPVLEIGDAASLSAELPNLEDSWAWAHAQVLGSPGDTRETLKLAIETAPTRTLSRLVCPRRLDPDVTYVACVVPAFEVGRKAGLGLPVPDDELAQLAPAWTLNGPNPHPFQLPVFHSWEFTTGPEGDFESLVRDLEPRALPTSVGSRPLDTTTPGFGLPSGGVLPMKGILKPPEPANAPPPVVPQPLQAGLAAILNAPADALASPSGADPIVAPPIYGAKFPPRDRVAVNATPAHWINDLNLDPRDRVAASLGTRIVQEDQEHLMASAWQQVDAVEKENQARRLRRLATVNRQSTWARHMAPLGADRLLQVSGVGLAKVAVDVAVGTTSMQRTVAWQVSGSEAPGFESAVLRRVARPRGPINRRALTAPVLLTQTQARPLVKLLQTLPDVDRIVAQRPPRVAVGTMVTIKNVSDRAGMPTVGSTAISGITIGEAPFPTFLQVRETQGRKQAALFGGVVGTPVVPRLMEEFRQAAAAHLAKAIRIHITGQIVALFPDMGTLVGRLKPPVAVARGLAAGRTLVDGAPANGALANGTLADAALPEEEILAHPQFPAPMAERLMELAPDFLLPGLDTVPPNTVTLVQPNSRFIEAFLIGLNHEMGRELLWREYPTDQRGSYFRSFWDRRGADQQPPVKPIDQWNQPLGKNPSGAGSPDQVVLLVRGELFRRYPSAVIYAARATGDPAAPSLTAEERYPLFRGSASPDITFFGFALTEAEARGTVVDPGWFFVIQQQPGEPDFGLDMPGDPVPQPARVTDWNQLTWRHLVNSAEELQALRHVKVGTNPNPPRPDTSANPPGAQWGANGAHMARITLQKPVRIAVLARKMLPN